MKKTVVKQGYYSELTRVPFKYPVSSGQKSLTGYSLLKPSKWPVAVSVAVCMSVIGLVMVMHQKVSALGVLMVCAGLSMMVKSVFSWFEEFNAEKWKRQHGSMVARGIKVGMALFISSEAAFFVSFFWAFSHACWGSCSMNMVWPPMGFWCISPWKWPMYNCALLIGSGLTVTYAHKAAKWQERSPYAHEERVHKALNITCFLGGFFMLIQGYEYWSMPFSMVDGVYGSCFYMMTGFHGMHVIAGSVWLCCCSQAASNKAYMMRRPHLGVQMGVWYWHFVDVVWLMVWGVVYVNGSVWY
uniref:Cytochrome c oxidase subunit 3 n=1 Tax=Hippopus hippopus TaxID=80818 RepID=A0A3S5H357_9BIVA|nr:cytochrome oxidase subunit 3 [Hippopus hippopus]QNK04087.1 cytochrome c oxidase subunit III [Hippopus hippopus]